MLKVSLWLELLGAIEMSEDLPGPRPPNRSYVEPAKKALQSKSRNPNRLLVLSLVVSLQINYF